VSPAKLDRSDGVPHRRQCVLGSKRGDRHQGATGEEIVSAREQLNNRGPLGGVEARRKLLGDLGERQPQHVGDGGSELAVVVGPRENAGSARFAQAGEGFGDVPAAAGFGVILRSDPTPD
jgi:hypothetical protein